MVQAWWAAGIAVPAFVINKIVAGRNKPRKDDSNGIIRSDESGDSSFVCERVCTSDRLLRRMGDLSKTHVQTLAGEQCASTCTKCQLGMIPA